jgi:5'-3' exonuclease
MFKVKAVVLDDSSHPGEGEHKILPVIRKLKGKADPVVIMSPDNDLLSLGILTGKSNVYVLRYMDKFCADILKMDIVKTERQMVFISIAKIQEHFCREQEKAFGKQLDTESLLIDYQFLLSMVGNDFVCSLPYMKIKSGGLDKLIQIYSTIHHTENAFLIDKETLRIHPRFFIELVRQLACMENNEMKNLSNFIHREIHEGRPMKDEDQWTASELFENRLNHLYLCNPHHPLHEEYKSDFTKIDYTQPKNEWKAQYYEFFCQVNPKNYREYNMLRSKIVGKYLESLSFTLFYYNRECPSWSWYYPYRVAPLFSDVYTNLTKLKFDMNDIVFPKGQPFSPFQQLMLILPSDSKHILPKQFYPLFEKYKSFYPNDFRIDALQGMKYIYSEAILPEMHAFLQFTSDVKKIEKVLPTRERERNLISKGVYKFNFA